MTPEPHLPIDHSPGGPLNWIVGRCAPTGQLPPDAMRRYLVAVLLTTVLGLAAAATTLGPRVLAVAAACAGAALLVELLFAAVRHRPMNGSALPYGFMLALLLPLDVPLEMAALGGAVAALFGKEAFGGTGSHIFAPALVGKAALVVSYPQVVKGLGFGSVTSLPVMPVWTTHGAICLVGIVLLAWARPANLRILAAALLASVCLAIPMQQLGNLPFEGVIEMLLANGYLLTICLVICDPAISPRDDEAKWLYGLMIGALGVLMACFSTYEEAIMSAVLVVNLFVPTLDLLAQPGNDEEAEA